MQSSVQPYAVLAQVGRGELESSDHGWFTPYPIRAVSTDAPTTYSQRIWPRCGTSAAVFRDDRVLLIQRAKGAFKGLWSLPGGHIEPGESAKAAAVREVREETGVDADIRGIVDLHEVILRERDGAVRTPYLIAVHWGLWRAGEPVAGSDAAAARFVRIDDIETYPLTEGAADLIRRGRKQALDA
jgi:8-oxo-dGTP diphosphatase